MRKILYLILLLVVANNVCAMEYDLYYLNETEATKRRKQLLYYRIINKDKEQRVAAFAELKRLCHPVEPWMSIEESLTQLLNTLDIFTATLKDKGLARLKAESVKYESSQDMNAKIKQDLMIVGFSGTLDQSVEQILLKAGARVKVARIEMRLIIESLIFAESHDEYDSDSEEVA